VYVSSKRKCNVYVPCSQSHEYSTTPRYGIISLSMNVTVVMVQSLNGKTTKGECPDDGQWKSTEDQNFFHSLHKKYSLVVMGKKTYEVFKHHMVFQKNQLRIVMTSHPELYATQTIPHKLEFTDESPQELVMRVSKNGYKTMLLAGGGTLNTAFFKSHLVNELYLTIEPILFGDGISIVTKDCQDIHLHLLSVKRLNTQGTLLLQYRIE